MNLDEEMDALWRKVNALNMVRGIWDGIWVVVRNNRLGSRVWKDIMKLGDGSSKIEKIVVDNS